jgi:hypothetical protein
MASALEQVPVGDRYAQVSYETLVKMRRELKDIFGPCNERLMLKAMRLYGAFATLNVRFSNDKLLSMGMPKPPRFTDYIDRCVQTTRGFRFRSRWPLISNKPVKPAEAGFIQYKNLRL